MTYTTQQDGLDQFDKDEKFHLHQFGLLHFTILTYRGMGGGGGS